MPGARDTEQKYGPKTETVEAFLRHLEGMTPKQWDAAEAVLTIAQLTMEKEQLMEKIDCVETELFEAVQVAYYRGATEWARLNYPNWIDRLTVADRTLAEGAGL